MKPKTMDIAETRWRRAGLWAAGLCLSLACASGRPGPVGSLTGRAVDDGGNALPGITVSLRSESGKVVQTVLTSADGSYSFQDVPAGRYEVITLFAGFSSPRPLDATVTPGTTTALQPLVLLPPDVTDDGRTRSESPPAVLVAPTPTP